MSEFTAVGPARNLDGPLPVAPPYRLLSLPGVLVEGDSDWLNGVNVWGYPCDTPSLWEPCYTEGTFGTKLSDSTSPLPRFDSFVAYLPITCSTISGDPRDFARRAEAVMEATISWAVEKALAQGVQGSTNPFFGDSALTVLAAGSVPVEAGLAYLENAIGATGRGGIIHATPAVIAAWGFEQVQTEGGVIRTANGTPVSSGGGYAYPVGGGPQGEQAVAAGQDWAFATGPVRVYVADGPDLVPSEYVDRTDNVITYRAEKFVLATWDTCLQAGVLIDWTP